MSYPSSAIACAFELWQDYMESLPVECQGNLLVTRRIQQLDNYPHPQSSVSLSSKAKPCATMLCRVRSLPQLDSTPLCRMSNSFQSILTFRWSASVSKQASLFQASLREQTSTVGNAQVLTSKNHESIAIPDLSIASQAPSLCSCCTEKTRQYAGRATGGKLEPTK